MMLLSAYLTFVVSEESKDKAPVEGQLYQVETVDVCCHMLQYYKHETTCTRRPIQLHRHLYNRLLYKDVFITLRYTENMLLTLKIAYIVEVSIVVDKIDNVLPLRSCFQ